MRYYVPLPGGYLISEMFSWQNLIRNRKCEYFDSGSETASQIWIIRPNFDATLSSVCVFRRCHIGTLSSSDARS